MDKRNLIVYSIQGKITQVVETDTVYVELYPFPNIIISNLKMKLDGIKSLPSTHKEYLKAKQTFIDLISDHIITIEFTASKLSDKYFGKFYLENEDISIYLNSWLLEHKLADVYHYKNVPIHN